MSTVGRIAVCFTSGKGRKVASIREDATTEELYHFAETEYGISVSNLKCGFPPKPLLRSADVAITTCVQQKERIQVEFGSSAAPASAEGSAGGTKRGKRPAPAGCDDSNDGDGDVGDRELREPKRSKRAASKRATAAMPAIIQAQEEAMDQQIRRTQKPKPTGGKITRGKGSNIAGFASSSSSSKSGRRPAASAAGKRLASKKSALPKGDGRRLGSGEVVKGRSSSAAAAAAARQRSQNPTSDLSEALLGALGHKGKMGQVLRKGMKNAVQTSYQTSQAFSRLAAIQSKNYVLLHEGQDAHSAMLSVTFSGSVDKQQISETVESIPRDVLEAVIRGIHASNHEALRPQNLSILSPRVLWNLVRIFPEAPSLDDSMKALLPDLDWSFLRRRAVQLSDKARENLRQQNEAAVAAGDDEQSGNADGQDRAADAILAVENAMDQLQETDRNQRKDCAARAAMRRLQEQQQQQPQHPGGEHQSESADISSRQQPWRVVTPSEEDRDELEACVFQSLPPCTKLAAAGEAKETEQEKKRMIQSTVDALLQKGSIHNWRELANVSNAEHLGSIVGVDTSHVQEWIDFAQGESVDEIMVEICDSNIDMVAKLTNLARTGTPKDLAGWRSIPESLLELLGSNSASSIAETSTVDAATISTWCNRSHEALQQFEWLNWYATPVE